MGDFFIDPVKQYEYNSIIEKSQRVTKSNTQEEFLNMVIEQIFLSKIVTSTGFVDEDEAEEESDDIITFKKNDVMDMHFKNMLISQLSENDMFGLMDALKKRGLANDR